MSTHTYIDQSGQYTYEVGGGDFVVIYDGTAAGAVMTEITDPDYIEWMSVADDLVQWVDNDLGFVDGGDQITYRGKFYNLNWD